MSHLDHVVRVKESLAARGVTCPFQQRDLIDQAYIDALVAHHFACNPTFTLHDKERDTYRCMLDKWNSVSPIGHEKIYSGVLSFINLTYSALRTKGRVHLKVHAAISENENTVMLEDIPEYNDLVSYLCQEVKNKHE